MDSKCPLFFWDLMLDQIDMQVNMLRQSNVTPKVSAFAHLNGQYDFNRHPIAPLDIEVHNYVPPDKRKTWEVKCRKGYYIGTSREHYRYFQAYIPETGGIQGSETMCFKHKSKCTAMYHQTSAKRGEWNAGRVITLEHQESTTDIFRRTYMRPGESRALKQCVSNINISPCPHSPLLTQ